ncbi:MAG: tetratricopeptide repeat protein [Elusimicrobia bacterium]|nr:tetratricopeptide repeat protein [Elusimicrobiota bacterium]
MGDSTIVANNDGGFRARGGRWVVDGFSLLIVASALAGGWAVQRFYRPGPPPPPFPRQPSEFRSALVLAADKEAALSALSVRADDTQALLNLAIIYFEEGAPVKALESLERARDLGVLDERLFYYAGVLYEAQGLPDYAVVEYEKFLRHRPDDLETRLRLANTLYRLDEVDRSIEHYRLVLKSRPGDPLVSYNLAMAYRDKKNWADGLAALNPFLVSGKPMPAGGHRLLGDLYLGSGNAARALSEYEKERELQGETLDVCLALATAAETLKKTDLAVSYWTKALALDPTHRDARARLRRLKQPVPARRRSS